MTWARNRAQEITLIWILKKYDRIHLAETPIKFSCSTVSVFLILAYFLIPELTGPLTFGNEYKL